MSVNKVILVGRLGAEPESRAFPNGGSCLVVFDGAGEQDMQISWINRDAIKPKKESSLNANP